MKLTRYQLEKAVEGATLDSKENLKSDFRYILEEDKDFTKKADYIGYSITSLEDKIKQIDEEVKELRELKKNFTQAKSVALEACAEVLGEFGVDKIEGSKISSLTVAPHSTKDEEVWEIDEDLSDFILVENKIREVSPDTKLTKLVLDQEAIKEAYRDKELRKKFELEYRTTPLVSLRNKKVEIPAKLKVNKRRK